VSSLRWRSTSVPYRYWRTAWTFLEDAALNFLIFCGVGMERAPPGESWHGALRHIAHPGTCVRLGTLVQARRAGTAKGSTANAYRCWRLTREPLCAFILVRFRHESGSLTKAAFLSSRNDAFANIAIISAGVVTLLTRSLWPDLVVGLGIAGMNLNAAREVWVAAHDERHSAVAEH